MPALITAPDLLALTAILAYLAGSIPFGIVISKLFGLADPRSIGSGNIGATNVLRSGSKLAAFLTLIMDAGKGGFAVLIARTLLGEDAAQLAGFAAFLGHCFPIYLGFKGGKGVATWLGTLFALAWPLGLAAGATWLVSAALFRISSLAALIAAVLVPIWAVLLERSEALALTVALGLLILIRHHANIARILRGEEPKIGRKG